MGTEINGEEYVFGRIGEMGTADAVAVDLPVPADFLAKVKAEDENPVFVTAEVESGWSRSKRLWKPAHLRKVVDRVNSQKMGGTLGHPLLDPKQYDSAFPKPQVVWVAATLKETGDKAVARFKGYVLKTAEAREYLKLGLIDGVSIFGPSRMKPISGGYEVLDFDPESIDFARKGRSGMTSRVVALAGEQASRGGNEVEPKEIAALSEDELRTHAPLLVREIERKAVEPVETKVGEQATVVAELQPQADMLAQIKELLKLTDGENPVEKVTALISKIEEAASSSVKDYILQLVEKKVKTPRAQNLVKRLIGEMWTEYEGPLTDDLKKKIDEDFTAKVEGDEDMKELVGEMATGEEHRDGDGGTRFGGRSRAGESRGRGSQGGNVVRENENIRVRTVKL